MDNFAQNYVKLDFFRTFLFKKGVNLKSLVAALHPCIHPSMQWFWYNICFGQNDYFSKEDNHKQGIPFFCLVIRSFHALKCDLPGIIETSLSNCLFFPRTDDVVWWSVVCGTWPAVATATTPAEPWGPAADTGRRHCWCLGLFDMMARVVKRGQGVLRQCQVPFLFINL